jgi:hypothetical protein
MLVAQRIVRDALREGLGAGDMLEPERVMLGKYETGRGTLLVLLMHLRAAPSATSSRCAPWSSR